MRYLKAYFLCFCVLVFYSCSEESASNAKINIRLTDSPAAYNAVYVDIQEVQINYSEEDKGWVTLDNCNKGIYNLLDYTGSKDTLLVDASIPEGTIHQIRLVLGDNNSLEIEGKSISLTTPSAQQSGLRLKVDLEVVEGVDYGLTIDFDAARSIVSAGKSGKFLLKPVLRGFVEANNGSIAGSVAPTEIKCLVSGVINEDTINTYTDSKGYFLLKGLDPGSYLVLITPDTASMYNKTKLEDVNVMVGIKTDLGSIELEE